MRIGSTAIIAATRRFLPYMKRSNRREFRRTIKNDLRKQIRGEEDRAESKGDE